MRRFRSWSTPTTRPRPTATGTRSSTMVARRAFAAAARTSSVCRCSGWVQPFWDEIPQFEELIMGEYDLLLGKRTYDIFAAYWPYNQDNPIGEKFQRINKYVLTHSDEPLKWENSYRLSGETAAAVAELKRSEGRDLLIQGSSTLYAPLLS